MNKCAVRLGINLRKYRVENNYTQAEVAEIINVNTNHYNRIENGAHFTTFNMLEKFTVLYRCDISDLFCYIGDITYTEVETILHRILKDSTLKEQECILEVIENMVNVFKSQRK